MSSVQQKGGYFSQFASNVTSQHGEDGILKRVFEHVLSDYSTTTDAAKPYFAVDVGAWDGKHLSNTYSLFNSPVAEDGEVVASSWKGILLEADKVRSQDSKDLYGSNDDVVCVNTLVQLDGPSSLSALLLQVTFLSLEFYIRFVIEISLLC